jgi:nucleoside-diphosphate-sugar epimerase
MTVNANKGTALVLGATGGIGGEVARQLLAAGWSVRALARSSKSVPGLDAVAWSTGDVLDGAAVRAAAQGCDVIVHAVNPPGYRDWDKLVLPMLHNTLAAAAENRALVVLPGTLYNYAPDVAETIAENAPQEPATRKGAIRVQMEAALREHARSGGRVLVLRAGDFFGPHCGNSWFAQGLIKPGRPVTSIANASAPGAGHQWAYLPDVAATMVALIERRSRLEPFARFHMAGHWDPDGRAMPEAIARAAARHGAAPRITAFPWWLVVLASPFVHTFHEMLEMRYMWKRPVRLDNRKLVALLGAEPHTPLDVAVERTLAGLGCLPAAQCTAAAPAA